MKNDINHISKILDTVTRGYVSAIYFTDTGAYSEIPEGADMASTAVISCFSTCADFLLMCQDAGLLTQYEQLPGVTWDSFGIDFWFTRNRHGCGFWDRGYGELGDKLSEAAKTFGTVDAYLGDDSLIYLA